MGPDTAIRAIVALAMIGIVVTVAVILIQEIKGPVVDISIASEVDSSGAIKEYSVQLTMNENDYTKYLRAINGQNYESARQYFFRGITNPSDFSYSIKEGTTTVIKLSSDRPFEPWKTTFINTSNEGSNLKYEDSSLKVKYFIPDEYIDELSYSLTLPSAVVNSSADKPGNPKWNGKTTLSWKRNRERDEILKLGQNVDMPNIWAIYEKPAVSTPGFGILLTVVSIFMILVFTRRQISK